MLCAFDLGDGVGGGAVAQQHEPRPLQLDGEGGQRVREDVVHVAGDPGAFGERRRAGVLLLHPRRVHELELALLLAPQVLPAAHPEQQHPGQPEQGDATAGGWASARSTNATPTAVPTSTATAAVPGSRVPAATTAKKQKPSTADHPPAAAMNPTPDAASTTMAVGCSQRGRSGRTATTTHATPPARPRPPRPGTGRAADR